MNRRSLQGQESTWLADGIAEMLAMGRRRRPPFLFMIYRQNTAAVPSDKMTSGAVLGFCAQEVRRHLLNIISEELH